MGQHCVGLGALGLPAWVGVAAASDQGGHRQSLAQDNIHSHGGTLGESQHRCPFEWHGFGQFCQSLPQVGAGGAQAGPIGLLEVVPLPAEAARVRFRCPQGHHADLVRLAIFRQQGGAQIQQIIRIGPPAVQQHQATLRLGRSQPDGLPIVLGQSILGQGVIGQNVGHGLFAAAA